VRSDQGFGATGGVAGDGEGFRGAWCRVYQGIVDPLIIEALAFRDAIYFAEQRNLLKITCESDCEDLVRLWRDRHTQRSVIAPILSEAEDLVSSFEFFELRFVGRSANFVAHECARYACDHRVEEVWLDRPVFLRHSLQADCNSV
jgi:hypothetical protein